VAGHYQPLADNRGIAPRSDQTGSSAVGSENTCKHGKAPAHCVATDTAPWQGRQSHRKGYRRSGTRLQLVSWGGREEV